MCVRVSRELGHEGQCGLWDLSRLCSSVLVGVRCVQNLCLNRRIYSGQPFSAPVFHLGYDVMRSNMPSHL